MADYNGDKNICMNCKWMNQGENSCKCYNPKQTKQDLIDYTYWPSTCELFEKGKRVRYEKMKKLGYNLGIKRTKLAIGKTHLTYYYQ